jgi:peptidoglycan/xylan/chitin deacetylase (PgdA/CDA1 family)
LSAARRAALAATGCAGLAGAAYGTFMSPTSQLLGTFPHRGDGGDRRVALTFDDGPNEPFTSALADVLADRDVRATFFQVGVAAARTPDVTRRLVGDGHVIGNHSLTHTFANCLRPSVMAGEIAETQQILGDVIGRMPALYRPPWLLRVPGLFPVLRDQGLSAVSGQFCHPLEVLQPSAARIAGGAVAKAGPGRIVIFHDGFDGKGGFRGRTVEAVKVVIDELRSRGYEFATVDDLLGLPAYAA